MKNIEKIILAMAAIILILIATNEITQVRYSPGKTIETNTGTQIIPSCENEGARLAGNDECIPPAFDYCQQQFSGKENLNACISCCGDNGQWGPGWQAQCRMGCNRENIPPITNSTNPAGACEEDGLQRCIRENPLLAIIVENLQQRGCMPTLRCTTDSTMCQSDNDQSARYCCNTNTVNVCNTRWDMCQTLNHELVHALDFCGAPEMCGENRPPIYPGEKSCGGIKGCKEWVCTEIRAFAYSGQYCQDGELQRNRLLFHMMGYIGGHPECLRQISLDALNDLMNQCVPSNACQNSGIDPYPLSSFSSSPIIDENFP